ncbi:MAG: hypothetical protein ACRD2X_11225 [Vicinamibacteraceae bacterium]
MTPLPRQQPAPDLLRPRESPVNVGPTLTLHAPASVIDVELDSV